MFQFGMHQRQLSLNRKLSKSFIHKRVGELRPAMEYAIPVRNILFAILISSIAVLCALAVHGVCFAAARRISRRTGRVFDESLIRHSERPLKLILPLLAFLSVSPGFLLPERAVQVLRHWAGLVLIGSIPSLPVPP